MKKWEDQWKIWEDPAIKLFYITMFKIGRGCKKLIFRRVKQEIFSQCLYTCIWHHTWTNIVTQWVNIKSYIQPYFCECNYELNPLSYVKVTNSTNGAGCSVRGDVTNTCSSFFNYYDLMDENSLTSGIMCGHLHLSIFQRSQVHNGPALPGDGPVKQGAKASAAKVLYICWLLAQWFIRPPPEWDWLRV